MAVQNITGNLTTHGTVRGTLNTKGRLSGSLSVGGGVSSYNELKDLPKLNNHIIKGNKTSHDYDIINTIPCIDTNNLIKPFEYIRDTLEHTYTAVKNCVVLYTIANAANTDTYIKINDIKVGGIYSTAITSYSGFLYLKAGQTFSFQQTFTQSSYTGYGVYEILND